MSNRERHYPRIGLIRSRWSGHRELAPARGLLRTCVACKLSRKSLCPEPAWPSSPSLPTTVAPFDCQLVLSGAEGDRLARRPDANQVAVELHISVGAVDDDLDPTVVGGYIDNDAQRDQ